MIGDLFFVEGMLRVEGGPKVEFLEKGETFVILELGEGIKILTTRGVRTVTYGEFYLQFDFI
jgi:hypothetical protein